MIFKIDLGKNANNLHKWKKTYWKKLENIIEKGEITHYEPFLLLQQCQKYILLHKVKGLSLKEYQFFLQQVYV